MGILIHFIIGFFCWLLFILHARNNNSLTNNKFHYSYIIIMGGWLSLFGFIVFGFINVWDKLGQLIIGLPMGIRENKVETYLRQQVKLLKGDTRKWVSPGRDGVPDQIVFVYYSTFFVEVKTTDGRLSEAQKREHERLRALGSTVCTVWGNHGVDLLISDVKRWERPTEEKYHA